MLVVFLLDVGMDISSSTCSSVPNSGANLLEQIINLKVHLEDGLFASLVMERNNKRSRRRRRDIEIDIGTANG